MGHWGQRGLALALAFSLAIPLESAPKPLGMVLAADQAKIRRDFVQTGTNIYPGDTASTEVNGSLQMKLGPAQVYLGGDSRVDLQENDGRVTALLQRGRIGFTVEGEESILVHAAGTWIRAQGPGRTTAEVTLVNGNEFVVAAKGGALEVIAGDETAIIPQEQSARVQVNQPGPDLGTKPKDRRRRIIVFFLVGAGVAAIVTCAVLFNTGHTNNNVSPSVVRDNGHCK